MQAEKFELFMGHLGNGITVCNKAVEINGEYKTIAHISKGGNIRLYVEASYIPANEMEKIKATAKIEKENFKKRFEALPKISQYGKILEEVPHEQFLEFLKDKSPFENLLSSMREYYYTIA